MVNQRHLELLKRDIESWNMWRRRHRNIQVDLSGADLRGVNLRSADLRAANLSRANLSGADLFEADLYRANLFNADLSYANLAAANLFEAFLSSANLSGAMLSEANLSEALLIRTDLNGADLRWARLDRANLREANLTSCRVHGLSACNVELDQSKQSNLILSDSGESVTIDHLEMAQFIYLTQNTHISNLFDSIVLLVGQFSGRTHLLNILKMNLCALRYIPVSFDLDTSASIESCLSIARLARFLLVDLTNGKNISPLIQAVIAQRVLPIQPLFDVSQKKRTPCPDFSHSPWVLPVYRYRGQTHLCETFKENVIEPAEEMACQWWEVSESVPG